MLIAADLDGKSAHEQVAAVGRAANGHGVCVCTPDAHEILFPGTNVGAPGYIACEGYDVAVWTIGSAPSNIPV
jgi:hypothetical protein